jgi:hypothetical protein
MHAAARSRRSPEPADPCRDLKGHADGERQIGEVEVTRWCGLIEVHASVLAGVVEHPVAQSEDCVDQEP